MNMSKKIMKEKVGNKTSISYDEMRKHKKTLLDFDEKEETGEKK